MSSLSSSSGGSQVPTSVVYESGKPPQIEYRKLTAVVVEGPDEGASVDVASPVVLGSGKDADLRLRDRAVSRRHVELRPAVDGLWMRDLGSTNGTHLRGTLVKEALLEAGEVLELGRTRIEIRSASSRRRAPLSRRTRFGDLLGSSTAMRRVFGLLEKVAPTEVTVLLEGETGTGKELAARALHGHSSRAAAPWVVVDCSAVSPTLVESLLFGHAKGAFTGADRDRAGAFEEANGGTVFLDEIGELPPDLQPKLLRVLQEREVRRLGEHAVRPVDVRVVAATNRKLADEVERGRFREDLYYRLAVFRIELPPLRERPEDIPALVRHFLADKPGLEISDETVRRLQRAPWPGNVRELYNAVERAVLLAADDLPEEDAGLPDLAVDSTRPFKEVKGELVAEFERRYLTDLLERTGGNVSKASREARIDRKHLERLIRKHGLR